MLDIGSLQVQEHVLLSTLSTFGIGGPADYFCEVDTPQALKEAITFSKESQIPYLVIGKGSNCLFDDLGFRGLVIRMKIESFHSNGMGLYEVGAGYSFAQLGRVTAQDGYQGLEFAAGIPATVGGAVYMNAGASGSETKDALVYVDAVLPDGSSRRYMKGELSFSYRYSSFQSMKGSIIVGACFQLQKSEKAKQAQKEIVEYRLKTQPYKDKSAGCIFRNPSPMAPSGKLIESSGLKGLQVGGAEVSTVHANFIVNRCGATCEDVKALIRSIQEKVYQETGYRLESEVRIIDQWGNTVHGHTAY